MERPTERCPVCGNSVDRNNPALYAMGWHVVVCSRKCQQDANRLLATYGTSTEYAGPDNPNAKRELNAASRDDEHVDMLKQLRGEDG